MNKSLAGILGVTVALTLLAGCTAYDRTKDQFTQPVVKDVKKGMSRQQVMQIAGKPSTEVTMVHARGTCQTYILGQRDGKVETYFVALDETGHVMNSGYQTCAEYDTDPRNAEVSFLLFTDFYVSPTTGRAFFSNDAYLIARIIWMKM